VLDVIQILSGPDIALWSSHFIAKPQGDGKAVPWHTAGAYWRNRAQPDETLLHYGWRWTKSSVENGCMRVIPGSHRELGGAVSINTLK